MFGTCRNTSGQQAQQATQQQTQHRREHLAWQSWEDERLIEAIEKGETLEEVAEDVCRSLPAVQSRFERLGNAELPEHLRQRLSKLQAKRPRRSVDERTRAALDQVSATLEALLAIDLACGRITPAELNRFLGADGGDASLTALAARIRAAAQTIIANRQERRRREPAATPLDVHDQAEHLRAKMRVAQQIGQALGVSLVMVGPSEEYADHFNG
jgi:hypothetical protein